MRWLLVFILSAPCFAQTFPVNILVSPKSLPSINIKSMGAVCDGAHVAADTTGLQNAVTAAGTTGQRVYVPAGTCQLTNSSTPALTGAHNVIIWGDGPQSQLICQTVGGQDCIQSTGANGFGLVNLAISFGPTATVRSSGYAVNIQSCTNCLIDGVVLNNGDLSGLRLASSTGTSIHNLKVSNFFANATFMINDQDLRVNGLGCSNNGDACFEVSWFDSEFTAHAIPCQNITGSNITSSNDVEAVLVNACNNVSVSNFASVGSAKEAVFIGQDPTTTTAHWPDRISISNGSIYGAGYGTNTLNSATAQGLYINVGTSPGSFVSHIAFSNITGTHISSWGLQMAELQNDDVNLSNISFYDIGNGNTTGCLQTEGNYVNLDNVACSNSGTYGLYDTNTNRLTGTNVNLNNSSQVSGTQAVFLSATATGFVSLNGVTVADNKSPTYSSSIFDASTSGDHAIYGIRSSGTVTPTGPTSNNGGTTYTYADSGHSFVLRNGGTIESFTPPNVYLLPTAGTTGSAQVNGAVFYYQSKCRVSPPTLPELTESIGWLDLYPTLTTESFALNQTGGCGFPLTLDVTVAASVLAKLIVANGIQPNTIYSAAGTALPSCNAGIKGEAAVVSDAPSASAGVAYGSGGGAITWGVLCSYNGSSYAWLTH